jgi:hypothetical protein
MAAFLIYFQIKSFEAWNRKQSSHQILNDFVSGSIEDTLETLESKFGWDVLHDERTYREVAGKTQNLAELDQLLRRLLRRFEAILHQHGPQNRTGKYLPRVHLQSVGDDLPRDGGLHRAGASEAQ